METWVPKSLFDEEKRAEHAVCPDCRAINKALPSTPHWWNSNPKKKCINCGSSYYWKDVVFKLLPSKLDRGLGGYTIHKR